MALPSFFKIPKHRTFNFVPRYYNERKEKLEERIRSAEQELGIKREDEVYQPRITRGSMRGYIHKSSVDKKKSSIRLFVILGILLLVVYLMLFR